MSGEEILQLLTEDGFIENHSPNKYMRQFKDTDNRVVDYYFTTGTIVVQGLNRNGKAEVIRKNEVKYNLKFLHSIFVG